MELRVLNYFLTVAREENFTKAAEQLHLTQPTLSRQIAALEDELGTKLFIRANHNIILTEDGMLLKRRAGELLSLAERTKKDFLEKDANLEGTITLGCGEFLSSDCLTDCIAAFSAKYPRVRYEMISGNAIHIHENLERGLLDFGLVAEPIDTSKYSFITMPKKEEWGVLVRDDSPLAGLDRISPQNLAGHRLITPANEMSVSRFAAWFGRYSDSVETIARGNLLYNQASLARSGLGVVVTIRLACEYDGLKFIPFAPAVTSSTALIWKKQLFAPTVTGFIDFAKRYFEGISDDTL